MTGHSTLRSASLIVTPSSPVKRTKANAGMSQRLYETALAVLGNDALLLPSDEHAIDDGTWGLGFLASRATSINPLTVRPPR